MLDVIQQRRSIRKYKSKPVAPETIQQLLESARWAPSGSNSQPWHFVVVTSPAVKEKLVEIAHHQRWMLTAPVFIVCVADVRAKLTANTPVTLNEASPQKELKLVLRDTAIAAEHIALEAFHLGLGACWVAYFSQEDIRPVLNIPSDKYAVCVLTIGYPDETPAQHPRKPLSEMVHYDQW